ncbi:lysozyme [Psychrobacter sp. W2-37-MNA-CIBAN-0211]|uniref:lysozyme n=1 Tax=Psychrobacter sp. W2-37-MNA-CIBAN-0211 TaxID=3140443 RepID=UPI0033273C23
MSKTLTEQIVFMSDLEFFNWLRSKQDDKLLSQNIVDGANKLLSEMSQSEVKEALTLLNEWTDVPAQTLAMHVSVKGSNVIKQFEGFRSHPYQDQADVWTIGYGNTFYENGRRVRGTDKPISKVKASKLKRTITNQKFAPAVNLIFAKEIKANKITQNMFDALVSVSYNIGAAGLKGSSMTSHIKAGNPLAAADAFMAWNKVRNPVTGRLEFNQGLSNRRAKERALFLS